MNWTGKLLAVALAAVAFLPFNVHAQSTAPAELNLGVEAFKQSAYAEAIQHLEKTVSLDPENQDAHLYLAKAYAKQFKPGVHTSENTPAIEEGIYSLNKVMALRPNDHGAMEMMPMMYIEKAAMECDDLAAREEDLKNLAAWMNKKEFGVSVKEKKEFRSQDFDKQL